MIQGNALLMLLLLPFAGSVAAALLPTGRNAEAWLAGGVAVAGLIASLLLYPWIAAGGIVHHDIAWLPTFGLALSIRVDGFAWLFLMLIYSIGLLVVLYARYYLSPKDPAPRFFALLLAFMGAMGGIVLSGNLVMLVVFWEPTMRPTSRTPASRQRPPKAVTMSAMRAPSRATGLWCQKPMSRKEKRLVSSQKTTNWIRLPDSTTPCMAPMLSLIHI